MLKDLIKIEENIIAKNDNKGVHIFLFGQGIFSEEVRPVVEKSRIIPIEALLQIGVDPSCIHDCRNNNISISDNTIWDPEDNTIYLYRRI